MAHHDPNRLTRDRDGGARVRLRFTREEADALQRAAGDVPVVDWMRQMLQAAVSGAPLDNFRDGEETVSIVAREPEASRHLLSSVDSVYIPTDFGGFVPLSQVAKVVPVLEQGIEWRRNRLPTITVRGTLPDGAPWV